MRLRIISDAAWTPPRLAPAPKREFNIFQLNRLGRMVQHAVGGPCLRRRGRGRVRSWAVIEYINTYLASDLSVTELAGVACLSPYHFGKMFKRSMGRTIHQFVTDRRIERAKSLLKSTPLNLLEIGAIVGFPEQSHFNSVFKRWVGVAPGTYRQEIMRQMVSGTADRWA